jgi:hypothetical protein
MHDDKKQWLPMHVDRIESFTTNGDSVAGPGSSRRRTIVYTRGEDLHPQSGLTSFGPNATWTMSLNTSNFIAG